MVMKTALIKRETGFTLAEMLVALVILSVSILAMTSVTITAIKTNTDNDMRNTAVRLTSEITEDLYIVPFDQLVTGSETRTVNMKGINKTFDVDWTVTSTTATLKQVVVEVGYDVKGKEYTNRSVFYRPSET